MVVTVVVEVAAVATAVVAAAAEVTAVVAATVVAAVVGMVGFAVQAVAVQRPVSVVGHLAGAGMLATPSEVRRP